MSKGIFGSLFDFNRDGKMSSFERAAEIGFLHHLMESEKKESQASSSSYGSFFSGSSVSVDDEDDDHEDRSLDLMITGLDEVELSLMDEDERHAALEDAGLDPYDFDYLDDF